MAGEQQPIAAGVLGRTNGAGQPAPTGLSLDEYALARHLKRSRLESFGLTELDILPGCKAVRIAYRDELSQETGARLLTGLTTDDCAWMLASKVGLYGLWKLPEARRERQVFVVAGEHNAHTLWQHGLPALAVPSGLMLQGQDWTTLLSGLEVFVWQEPGPIGTWLAKEIGTAVPTARILAPRDGFSEVNQAYIAGEDLPAFMSSLKAVARTYQETAGSPPDAAASDPANDAQVAEEVQRANASPQAPQAGLIVTGSELEQLAGQVQWLWPQWLARGVVTVLAAEQGIGKTSLILALAGILHRGGEWADGTPAPQGRALYVPAEGGLSEIAATMSRVAAGMVDVLLKSEDGDYFTLKVDTDDIRTRCAGYDLIIFDCLAAHAMQELKQAHQARPFMEKMHEIARQHKAAVVVLHHLNKADALDPRTEITLDRVRDSTDITAAPRTVWAIAPADDDTLKLSVIKSNLAAKAKPLLFTNDDEGITFLGEELDLAPVQNGWQRCATFLKKELANGRRPSAQVKKAAIAAGCTTANIREASEKLGVTVHKHGDGTTDWELPPSAAKP